MGYMILDVVDEVVIYFIGTLGCVVTLYKDVDRKDGEDEQNAHDNDPTDTATGNKLQDAKRVFHGFLGSRIRISQINLKKGYMH